ncbi:hypothetical protein M0805_006514 [Coniferiporia weirii]|nr:hypothetical protein M0805_006514 [Coniferiporia weirii]
MEQHEPHILIGTNPVQLSALDGVDLGMYQRAILPIFEQIVNCEDVIAQEYLMEVIIQVLTIGLHLYSLGSFLSATAQLQQSINIEQIVIALIDRLAAYAVRKVENKSLEETKRQEEAVARRLVEKVKMQKAKAWQTSFTGLSLSNGEATLNSEKSPTEEEENVKLFEVFWNQVDKHIKARPHLSIWNITALLLSLMDLSISHYPDRLEYVGQILGFSSEKIKESSESQLPTLLADCPQLNHSPSLPSLSLGLRAMQTTNNLASLLSTPTNPCSPSLLLCVLKLRQVLIHDQLGTAVPDGGQGLGAHRPPAHVDCEEMVEEQGWVMRVMHLFHADALGVQFEFFQEAQRHFESGGEQIRYTYPALIPTAIKLCWRYKKQQHEDDWQSKVSMVLKFTHQLVSILFTQVEAPTITLQLFLLAAHISNKCRFKDLTYDLYVQVFTMYKDSISNSHAGLSAWCEAVKEAPPGDCSAPRKSYVLERGANSYQSVLNLLMLSWYNNLLLMQPFMDHCSFAHSIITSVLKNKTSTFHLNPGHC